MDKRQEELVNNVLAGSDNLQTGESKAVPMDPGKVAKFTDPGMDSENAEKGSMFSWLFKRSKPDPVSAYMDHPLNIEKSEGMGQFIRGWEGLLGALNFALLDIIIGGWKMLRDKREVVSHGEVDEVSADPQDLSVQGA